MLPYQRHKNALILPRLTPGAAYLINGQAYDMVVLSG